MELTVGLGRLWGQESRWNTVGAARTAVGRSQVRRWWTTIITHDKMTRQAQPSCSINRTETEIGYLLSASAKKLK